MTDSLEQRLRDLMRQTLGDRPSAPARPESAAPTRRAIPNADRAPSAPQRPAEGTPRTVATPEQVRHYTMRLLATRRRIPVGSDGVLLVAKVIKVRDAGGYIVADCKTLAGQVRTVPVEQVQD